MIEVFQKKILDFIKNRDYKPVKLHDLAVALGIEDQDYEDFKQAYRNLRDQGQVLVGNRKVIMQPAPSGVITGKFQGNPKGFGFVLPINDNNHTDLFVPPSDINGAMTGDIVSVQVIKKGVRGGRMAYSGIVLEILERGHSKFVATLVKRGSEWIAKPDGTTIIEPIAVDDVSAKNVGEDDKVVVEIIKYPCDGEIGRGVIVKVLGKAGRYDTEIQSVIECHNIEDEFPEKCYEAARKAAESFDASNLVRREDITDQIIITIDPETAKDFDDAISVKKTKDGWQLGVHIADVSTFIPMESTLDIEARKRGNSVYLPGKTIPMLPEVLSNGICSLQPDQFRFTKSVYITYDEKGNIVDRNYANSLIKSHARLTYEQADEILKGKAEGFSGPTVALLKDMETLAKIIEARRVRKGMLHLDLPETEIELGEDGQAVDAHPADDSYPHTMIEMFMVEANEAVAALMDRFNIPFIRRIHPDPDSLTTKKLSRFVKVCGLKVPRKLDRKAMQDLIAAVKGTPEEFPINLHILRSLSKAEYSPLNIGHFALASQHYSHFTSPIRRYADLMLHRLLQVYIEERINMIGLEEIIAEDELKEIGKHITYTEQRAATAEDELKKVLILDLLSGKIGDELNGAVTGFNKYNVFVHIYKYGIDAMFDIKELGLDDWDYDDKHMVIVGRHSGRRLNFGSPIKVKIVSVSLPARQLYVTPSVPLVSERADIPGYEVDRVGRKKGKRHRSGRKR